MFDRVEGDTYTFIRNPYYWGEAPEVDEFKVKVIPDNAAKILALRNGEIDAILGSSRLSAEGYTEIPRMPLSVMPWMTAPTNSLSGI